MPSAQTDFSQALREGVQGHFSRTQRSSKGSLALQVKPFFFLLVLVLAYCQLVFSTHTVLEAFLWCCGMIFAMGGIGFGFAHDACHGAFAQKRRWNRLAGLGYDLMGASSYVWRWKHNILHHGSPNHLHHDPDIQTAPFLRVSREQPKTWFNQFQHLYFPLLYALILIRWQLWQDFATYGKGELLGRKFVRPRGLDGVIFWSGKSFSIFFSFVFPAFYHPVSKVLLAYFVVMGGLGLLLGTLIQVAHCTEGASYESLSEGNTLSQAEQVKRSANFSPRNHFLTWYTGGLNYQIEHHLFPSIASVHYPALAVIVRRICQDFGVPYVCYDNGFDCLRAHVRHLKHIGNSP